MKKKNAVFEDVIKSVSRYFVILVIEKFRKNKEKTE